jgi:hypothetical protein
MEGEAMDMPDSSKHAAIRKLQESKSLEGVLGCEHGFIHPSERNHCSPGSKCFRDEVHTALVKIVSLPKLVNCRKQAISLKTPPRGQ